MMFESPVWKVEKQKKIDKWNEGKIHLEKKSKLVIEYSKSKISGSRIKHSV